MQIRLMRPADLDQVEEMERQIFSDPWSRQSIENDYCQPDNIYLVAEADGYVAGYCGVWCSFECADLCNLAVAPEWRRRGVASALFGEAVRRCRSRHVERLLLEVRISNEPALSFYEKKGFRKIHMRKRYYRNPVEDAWVMQLLLE